MIEEASELGKALAEALKSPFWKTMAFAWIFYMWVKVGLDIYNLPLVRQNQKLTIKKLKREVADLEEGVKWRNANY